MGEGIDEITIGLCLEAFQGHGPAGRLADEAFQLIAPVRRDLGVGVHRKPLHAGTVGACQHGRLALRAKARADAPDLLAHPFPTGDALRDRGRQGTGERGFVLHQGVIACRHRRIATRFEVPQTAELADDPMADFLNHVCHVGIAGRLDRDKAGLAARLGAIEVDALKKDTMKMEIGVRRRLYLIF